MCNYLSIGRRNLCILWPLVCSINGRIDLVYWESCIMRVLWIFFLYFHMQKQNRRSFAKAACLLWSAVNGKCLSFYLFLYNKIGAHQHLFERGVSQTSVRHFMNILISIIPTYEVDGSLSITQSNHDLFLTFLMQNCIF